MYNLRNCRLVIVGPPQSGKGTWGRVIVKVIEKLILLNHFAETCGMRLLGELSRNGGDSSKVQWTEEDWRRLGEQTKQSTMRIFSTGDLLREQISERTAMGLKAESYVNEGELVPEALVNTLVCEKLEGLAYERFIIDGYPRTMDQARIIIDNIHNHDTIRHFGETGPKSPLISYNEVDLVIVVDCPEMVILKRIMGRVSCPKCGHVYNTEFENQRPKKEGICDDDGEKLIHRSDDTTEAVSHRLALYKQNFRGIDNLLERRRIPKIYLPGHALDEEMPQDKRDWSEVRMRAYYLAMMLDVPEQLSQVLSLQLESEL